MGRRKDEKREYQEIKYRVYTDAELKDFHEKVQKFYFNYTIQNGKVIRVMDKKKLMIAFGALSKSGAVITDEVSLPPNRLQQFENIYEQWQYWKAKVGLDKGSWNFKKLEQLDKMAEQMTIEPAPEEIPF